MLDYFGEQSWELDEVDKESTYECLKELIHEPVFDVIFKRCTEVSTKTKGDGSPLYKYVQCTLLIYFTEQLMEKFYE